VNCGCLPDILFEGELFGHERGAFTDAHSRRRGFMAQAAGGTLFLDEGEALTPRAQAALLRTLQDRTFRPLGSTSERA
jgi:DNA-binding NtrC family response regulator